MGSNNISVRRLTATFYSAKQAEEAIWKLNGSEVKIIGNNKKDFLFTVNYHGGSIIGAQDAKTRCGGRFTYTGGIPKVAIKTIRRGNGAVLTDRETAGLKRDTGLIFRTDHIIGYDISEAARTRTLLIDLEAFDRLLERHRGRPTNIAWDGVHAFHLDSSIGRLIETGLMLFDENHNPAPGYFYSEASIKLIKEALIVATAEIVESRVNSEPVVDKVAASQEVVRRGMDIIRSQTEPLSIHDLADLLDVGVRALQAGFRAYAGSPPHYLLRLGRLEGARRDLENDVTSTIPDTARKWGFSNAGRFAGEYFRAFGLYPSDTIRRRPFA